MSYSNKFLMDFKPVYFGILQAKQIPPEKAELEVIDEEGEEMSLFEPEDIKSVLEQIGADLNFLTIYTNRPAYFREFTETMYEENGLMVMVFPKRYLERESQNFPGKTKGMEPRRLVFDFEWQGKCYEGQIRQGKHYIPIHKKPWETAQNLDIAVPIGYNTVIVKRAQNRRKKQCRDRFEEAFYNL